MAANSLIPKEIPAPLAPAHLAPGGPIEKNFAIFWSLFLSKATERGIDKGVMGLVRSERIELSSAESQSAVLPYKLAPNGRE